MHNAPETKHRTGKLCLWTPVACAWATRCAVHLHSQVQSQCLSLLGDADPPLEAQVVCLQPVFSGSPTFDFPCYKSQLSLNQGIGCTVPDGPEQPRSGPPCTPLPTGAPLQLPRPVSGCLTGHLYSLLPLKSWFIQWTTWRDQKRTISSFSTVCLVLKIHWESWSSGFQFSFPSVHSLTNMLPLFQHVTKEEGKITPQVKVCNPLSTENCSLSSHCHWHRYCLAGLIIQRKLSMHLKSTYLSDEWYSNCQSYHRPFRHRLTLFWQDMILTQKTFPALQIWVQLHKVLVPSPGSPAPSEMLQKPKTNTLWLVL